jgi:hypothetical protein
MTRAVFFGVLWVATLSGMAHQISKKCARLSLKLTVELDQLLREQAALADRSVNWLVGRYITEGIDRDRRKGGRRPRA